MHASVSRAVKPRVAPATIIDQQPPAATMASKRFYHYRFVSDELERRHVPRAEGKILLHKVLVCARQRSRPSFSSLDLTSGHTMTTQSVPDGKTSIIEEADIFVIIVDYSLSVYACLCSQRRVAPTTSFQLTRTTSLSCTLSRTCVT